MELFDYCSTQLATFMGRCVCKFHFTLIHKTLWNASCNSYIMRVAYLHMDPTVWTHKSSGTPSFVYQIIWSFQTHTSHYIYTFLCLKPWSCRFKHINLIGFIISYLKIRSKSHRELSLLIYQFHGKYDIKNMFLMDRPRNHRNHRHLNELKGTPVQQIVQSGSKSMV